MLMGTGGYLSVFFGMVLESAGVPLPSEVILPAAGYLVLTGRLNFWSAVIAGLTGGVAGSILAYAAAAWGGRPLILAYGGRFGLEKRFLERAEKWFASYGQRAVFFGRLLPVVRTYISFPAGLAEMPSGSFVLYTVLGSLPWTLALVWAGTALGKGWRMLTGPFRVLDAAVVGALIVGAYILHRRRVR